ncbi:glycine--tRNA ligase subunit beta [Brevibacillus fluminis]|uniref:glycine--tRNA ligase subunit beta n=1 Tax=Brevibacillus fluminis TaxID=511487 RepID=UPI003F8AD9D0
MSKRDLLLEIGMEELPARFVAPAAAQLKEKLEKWLQTERISFDQINLYESPRRLAVLVAGVSEQQADRNDEAKGPAKKIAQDEAGNWSKAALGFARSNGVDPDALYFKEVNGVEYVHARKNEVGRATFELLPAIKDVIAGMSFPKNMRWGAHELKFARPIRWMIALFGDDIIPFEIEGVQTGRISRGHRFLGHDVTVTNAADYKQLLADQFVMVDPEERKEVIVRQLKELEQKQNWIIPIDEGLLDEVVHLVEYPTALFGTFEADFLNIPREVLITSMREHQRYFPVQDQQGKLLNHFVTVRNGDSRSLETVAKGNEKVLRARLADARFFYTEDQKLAIADCIAKLENIVFHEELGTIADKVRRTVKNADQIADAVMADIATVERAASIAKFDLVTNMVNEFPELQGIMGQDYAKKAGETEAVAQAIFEHYLPRFAGDILPESAEGAVVSISDKLDTIVGCFAIGIIPTGSQDPYGLRRLAAGIVNILVARNWTLSLDALFDIALANYQAQGVNKREAADVKKDLFDFFALRLKNVLQEEGVRYDVIDAVLATDLSVVPNVLARAKALMEIVRDDSFKLTVEQFNRVNNLAQKATSLEIDEAVFIEEVEKSLHQAYVSVRQELSLVEAAGDFVKTLEILASLREPIQTFFEQIMVMVEDEQVRQNRLALLANVAKTIFAYADFAKIVFA